jgi:GrpB-like predicted nucleotidyltransferase (UPF0157 family)
MENQKSFNYKDRKYKVMPYDSEWQKRFSKEALTIRNIFGEDIRIEHIGSTAVEGMEAKPCIDVLVILKDLEIVKEHISDMENVGYIYRGAFVRDDALLFARIEDNALLANIHFFPEGHLHIKEMIIVRDYLRSHPDEVLKYSDLKKRLYEEYPDDYAGYRKEKDEYMEKLMERAEGDV